MVVSHYYSGELVAYVRKVLQVRKKIILEFLLEKFDYFLIKDHS